MVKNTLYRPRIGVLLTTIFFLSHTVFADMTAPTPKRVTDQPIVPVGTDWGFIVSVGLFAMAGLFVLVWLVRKFAKRASK